MICYLICYNGERCKCVFVLFSRLWSILIMRFLRVTSQTMPWNVIANTMGTESGFITAILVRHRLYCIARILMNLYCTKWIQLNHLVVCYSQYLKYIKCLKWKIDNWIYWNINFPFISGDAFSEEAERKFEKYPGQLNNQIS